MGWVVAQLLGVIWVCGFWLVGSVSVLVVVVVVVGLVLLPL